jgi:hypothetical protein
VAQPYSGPKFEILRRNLGDLIAEGVVPSNVAEDGGHLLELNIVASRVQVDEHAEEEQRELAEAEALVAVLKAAVIKERIPARRHRRILKHVLPLKEEYLGTTIKERRTAAGQDLKPGKKAVKPGTIRTYYDYEPRALDELARVLVEMEAEYRGEVPPVSVSDAH